MIRLILLAFLATQIHADEIPKCEELLRSPQQIKTLADIKANLDKLKVSNDGTVEFGPDGFPDEPSYVLVTAAHNLLEKPTSYSPEDLKFLKNLERHYLATYSTIWSGDNAKLETISFRSKGAFRTSSDLSMEQLFYIRGGRNFRNGDWWMHDGSNVPPHGISITTANSGDTVLQAAGGTGSRVFWSLAEGNTGLGVKLPDMMGPHWRQNFDQNDPIPFSSEGKEKSVQLFAPETVTKITGPFWNRKTETKLVWQPFLFQRVAGLWIPRVNRLNKLAATDCASCHSVMDKNGNPLLDEEGKVVLSPRPNSFKTRADFRAAYKDERVIEAFIKAFPRDTD